MPRTNAAHRITRTLTVLLSTMLVGVAVPAASQAKVTSHVQMRRVHPAAGHTSPYTRTVTPVTAK